MILVADSIKNLNSISLYRYIVISLYLDMLIYQYQKLESYRIELFQPQEAPNPIPSSCNQLLVMRVLGAM